MNAFPEDIRRHYQPVQPCVLPGDKSVSYREFEPGAGVRSFVQCYWELKSINTHRTFTYRVVADGCIDVYFDINNPRHSYVMGFASACTMFSLNAGFHYFGIRFLPGCFPFISGIPALTLSDKYEEVSQVWPSLAEFLRENVNADADVCSLTGACDAFLSEVFFCQTRRPDWRVFESISQIVAGGGAVVVEELDKGISARQLRRLFEHYVGAPPKLFSKIVRFQHFLGHKHSAQTVRKNKTFFDAGYYDQSHFIRDFKVFFGDTPSRALRAFGQKGL